MKEYLNKLPKEILDLIHLASNVSSRKKMPAYLVGGFVRDLILGVKNLDLDIVVEGDGIAFADDLAHLLNAKIIRHKRFGTATIPHKCHLKIDIATARREFYPAPAHLPVVESSGLKDDHFRRDFTINAMAISISRDSFGQLIDFFKGQVDLRDKLIRIMHDVSFIDDPTRILRAIRFEQRYNFRIENLTLKRMKESVGLKMLEKVEPQRIRDELILILKEEFPLKEIKRIKKIVGFCFIKPKFRLSEKTLRLLSCIEKEICWFKKIHPHRRQLDAWLVYLMGLLDSFSVNDVSDFCQRFAFGKGEEKRIISCKKINLNFIKRLSAKGIKPSSVFTALSHLSYEAVILLKAKYKNRRFQQNIEDFLEIYHDMRIFISGEDIRKLGIAPGPFYQKVFTQVLNAKLDGQVKTKEEEIALIKSLINLK